MLTLFTRPDCKPCARLKALLDSRLVRYEEVDADDPNAVSVLQHHIREQVIVPTILHGGHVWLGWPGDGGEEVLAWLEELEEEK